MTNQKQPEAPNLENLGLELVDKLVEKHSLNTPEEQTIYNKYYKTCSRCWRIYHDKNNKVMTPMAEATKVRVTCLENAEITKKQELAQLPPAQRSGWRF